MRGDAELRRRELAVLNGGPRAPADGAGLLDELVAFIRRYVVITDDQASAVALWIVHAHAIEAAESTPYLTFTSPEKRSGKSRALEVVGLLVPRPLPTVNVSPAALFRTIATDSPTLLLDETDSIFNGKGSERAEELRGLLNAGHRRHGSEVIRMVGQGSKMQAERFPTFSAKALAGIGELPDTVADRSIAIRMQRKPAGKKVERFRYRDVALVAAPLRERLHAWVEPQLDDLTAARPDLPDALDDRAQDGWEPLLGIADAAGSPWPERARRAALALAGARAEDDGSVGVQLLADVRRAFDEDGAARLASAELCQRLNAMEEARWGGWREGKGIDARSLARRLGAYEVSSGTHRYPDGARAKGYRREDLEDAWERYCSSVAQSERDTVTTQSPSGFSASRTPSGDEPSVTPRTARPSGCHGVTDENVQKGGAGPSGGNPEVSAVADDDDLARWERLAGEDS